MNYFDHIAGRL